MTMQALLRRPASILATSAQRTFAFSTASRNRGIISKDRDDTLDPSKEPTDTTGQAKNQQGSNPAQQQANVVKEQSGQSGAAQTQATSDSELTEKKKKGEIPGRKPGEEAVNPAVKKH